MLRACARRTALYSHAVCLPALICCTSDLECPALARSHRFSTFAFPHRDDHDPRPLCPKCVRRSSLHHAEERRVKFHRGWGRRLVSNFIKLCCVLRRRQRHRLREGAAWSPSMWATRSRRPSVRKAFFCVDRHRLARSPQVRARRAVGMCAVQCAQHKGCGLATAGSSPLLPRACRRAAPAQPPHHPWLTPPRSRRSRSRGGR